MGIAALTILLLAAVVVLLAKARGGLVCPFCELGPIRRVGEMTQCSQCGRRFYLWQAKRK
jgi:hypothetical protein